MAKRVEKKNATIKSKCAFSGIEFPVYIRSPKVAGVTIIGWSTVEIIEAALITGD